MSLPANWVDRIFSKLTLTYGAAFMRTYEGLPLDEVKANWADELSGFQQCPSAIGYGLEHLPTGKPPNVLEFREICRREPARTLALPAPKAKPIDPAILRATRAAFKGAGDPDPKGWAKRLQAREMAGEKLTAAQRSMWRAAIGGNLAQAA